MGSEQTLRSAKRVEKPGKRRDKYARRPGYRSRRPRVNNNSGELVYLNSMPRQMDFSLLITILLLVMFGLVMVFSSSYYAGLTNYETKDALKFIRQQAQWAVIGTVAMFFMSQFDYRKIRKYTPLFYIAANILLVVVLVVAEAVKGSRRWLDLGFISFQPSELAKIATILYLASYLDKNKDILKTYKGFLKCMSIVVLPSLLVALQNFSTALVIGAVGTVMVFIASPVIWHFLTIILPVFGAGVIMVTLPIFQYRFERIKTWLDPFADTTGTGFQTVQSLYAVASGGLFGLGLGQSRQKLGYIPEAHNDIIFSVICEELGLFGATALILLFYALIYKGIRLALKCKDLFGTLIASGITCMVAIQVIINVAVNTNAMPVTGMPLPFISYGGSSLLVMMGCMGILLNISKYTRD